MENKVASTVLAVAGAVSLVALLAATVKPTDNRCSSAYSSSHRLYLIIAVIMLEVLSLAA